MPTAVKNSKKESSLVGLGSLPARIRAIHITSARFRSGWLAEAFAADTATTVVLEETIGVSAALGRLREQVFEVILVSHDPDELDALEFVEALRAGGSEESIIILGLASEPEMAALCYEVGADGYVCASTVTTRAMLWLLGRAIERRQMIRENRRLLQAERHRLRQEQREAEHLLTEQHSLLRHTAEFSSQASEPSVEQFVVRDYGQAQLSELAPQEMLSETIKAHYRELLRTHVIMGSGNMAGEMRPLAESFAASGISAHSALRLHLEVLEELVRGLGNRSARHVVTRADLLALDVLVHLAEAYRRRHLEQAHPAKQLNLPGFEEASKVPA